MQDMARGYILSPFHYLIWAAFNWYGWALFTPLIYALARRFPISRHNWAQRILFPHLLACCACVAMQAALRGIAGSIYTSHHEIYASPFALAGESIASRALPGVFAYCVIVAIAAFAHLRDEVRLRELNQAQLELRLASAELEKLRMQIHPHFLFNTLQAAITLVHDDPQSAEDVLLRLSQLLRITLDQMDTNEVPLARELEFLDLYVGIQRKRFGDRLSFEIHADPATLDYLVPPLLLQPLVENAIRHGIGKHKGEDTIEVFAREQNGGLQLEVWNKNSEVEDSGEKLFQRGVGLRNTKARLKQLYGNDASLIFRSLARRGAAVLISVPRHQHPQANPQPAIETVT
jgi:sensor histidine kinase YesM